MLEEKYIEFIFFHFFLIINMFENISPDSVRSGRTCPANLGVQFGQAYAQSSQAQLCIYVSLIVYIFGTYSI